MANSIPKLLSLSMAFLLFYFSLPCFAEFTVVMPDSSALVDAPQNKFSSNARTDPAEQRAVYEIMAATGNSWASSIPDVCRGRWHGIECMPDVDDVFHVVSLSFGALSDDTAFPPCDPATAYLSPALTELPHIRSLFFYRCFTSNPQQIPAFLGRLGTTLRSLVMRENGNVGALPEELGNLTSLKVLDLHGNGLSSSIPPSIENLRNLELLDLSNNKLAGAIPNLRLPFLHVLDLNHNVLHGKIPDTLGECSSLIKVDLSRNHLTGLIPNSIGNLKSLTLLDLSHNFLSGPLPSSLEKLTSLQALILQANPMKTLLQENVFSGMVDLTTLVLTDMELQGNIPESIAELRSLRVLHLDGNKLNGSIPKCFGNLKKLSELRLDNNLLTGAVPFDKEMLWRMGKKLRIYNNSGLCFEGSSTEAEEIAGATGYCNGGKKKMMEKSPETEHLSMSYGEGEILHVRSSAAENRFTLQVFVVVMAVALSVFPL